MLIENWKLPADLDSVAGKIEYVDFLVWLIMQSGGLRNRVYKTHVSRIQGLGMRLDDITLTTHHQTINFKTINRVPTGTTQSSCKDLKKYKTPKKQRYKKTQ